MAGELERLLIRVEADTAQLRRALANADKDVSRFADNADRSAGRVEQRFKSLMAGFATTYAVREAIKLSDAYVLMGNRLSVVTKSSEELNYVQERLFATAQNTRLDVTELNELYSRMAFALKDVGVSTNDVLRLTDTLSKATVVSGASQAEAAGALRQLSQAMASGVLRGQELNSVMEQLPVVADMIAKHMGITIGELRKLAEEGKLTSKTVRDAILASQDDIAAKFEKTNPTIAQGFTKLGNSLLMFVGQVGQATGMSNALAAALGSVADSIAEANNNMKAGKGLFGHGGEVTPMNRGGAGQNLFPNSAAANRSTVRRGKPGSLGSYNSGGGFDPEARGEDKTPAALDPWAASIIPPSAEEQLKEMKSAWDELHEAQLTTLDDLIGDKTETAATKMAALTAAVKAGEIGWQDYKDGVVAVGEQTQRTNDAMLSSTSQFLDTMFANNKTAATASALINTYQGITKALAQYPPPYSYAMAAMQAAMGFAQVSKIQSTSKNSSSSGGGAAPAAGAGAPAGGAASGGGSPALGTVTVKGLRMGELMDRRALRDLFEQINDMGRDGYRVQIV